MEPNTALSTSSVTQLIIIDSRVSHHESLLTGLENNTAVLHLNDQQDGLNQISMALAQYSNLDGLQIVSHGSSGRLLLGGSSVDADSLMAQQGQLALWGEALNTDADILLYGCNVAAGEQGRAFVDQLAGFTGADVAASDDLTGAKALGGNWTLEYATSNIEQSGFGLEQVEGYLSTLNWQAVGSAGLSEGGSSYTEIEVDSTGIPYMVYQDTTNDQKATLMKFEDGSWQTVGDAGFSAGAVKYTDVEFDSADTPYVVYQDAAKGDKATVMKFEGGNWQAVGSTGFSTGTANFIDMALDSTGALYVAYQDAANSNKATVMKFVDDSWQPVGSAGFSTAGVADTGLAFDNAGTPYVVYQDHSDGMKATLMKFVDDSWQTVGNGGFSAGLVSYTDVAFNSAGIPYVVYSDLANSSKATMMKFEDDVWQTVGDAGFSAGYVSFTNVAFDNTDTPYVVYQDGANSEKATVMVFEDDSWQVVGSTGISDGKAYFTDVELANDGTLYVGYRDFGNEKKATVLEWTPNELPALTSLNGTPTFIEGQNAVVLDSDVAISDAELDALNGGNGNYAGASLMLARNDEASADDAFSLDLSGSPLVALSGSDIQTGGQTFATFVVNSGALTINFTSTDTVATTALVNDVIQRIAYSNSSGVPPESVILDYSFNDGTDSTAGINQVAVTITPAVDTPPSSGGSGGTPPAIPTDKVKETVDGVEVEKKTTTDSDGNTSTTITIDPVSDSRQEDSGTNNGDKADIPLIEENDGNAALSVALPTGVGVTAEGAGEAGKASNSLGALIRLIDDTAEAGNKSKMLSGGEQFLQTLQDENLWVNKLTLTIADNTTPAAPIVISGNTQTITATGMDNSKAALVIDATSLPADTVLQLDDVEFAVIVGPATLTGGEGQNTVFAGAGSQTIVLGADDDQLYGGDGDDTVGSKGGDDLIFGENGNDTLFGGDGKDQLHGGRDTDTVTFDGNREDYEVVQVNGVITVTRKADDSDVDTLINAEQIQFADQNMALTYDSELNALAGLYGEILDRQADLGGFQWWAESMDNGLGLGGAVISIMRSDEFVDKSGIQLDQLSADAQVEALYTNLLNRDSDAEGKAFWLARLGDSVSFDQVAEGFMQSSEMQQHYVAAEGWDFFV